MDNFKRFMTFSRGERIAIITIVSMIVIMLTAKYIIINNPPKRDYFKHDLDSIIARGEKMMDSIRIADSIEKVKMKSSTKEKEIPRFARNDKKRLAETKKTVEKESVDMTTTIDLNTADTTLLKQLPSIGSAFAKWIVEYREKLGGYCEKEQLLEVYKMDSTRYNELKDKVKTDSLFVPNKLKINSDAFKVLLKHPYLEYDDVKKIVNYREQKGLIVSWEQLVKVVGDTINPRLRYYVEYQ